MAGRLLLTGAGGMVGRNIRDHTAAQGWEILAPGSAQLDLTDPHETADFIATQKPDVIVHAAGRVGGIQANMAHPVAFLREVLTPGYGAWRGAGTAEGGRKSFV